MADMTFRQQMDPRTGAFTHAEAAGYSPAALVMVHYSWRLVGVCEEADALHWDVRPDHPAASQTRLAMQTDAGRDVAMTYRDDGADLSLGGSIIGRISGGAAWLVTDKQGRPMHLLGIDPQRQTVQVQFGGRPPRRLTLRASQTIPL
jgi:hypothetical protein